MIKKIRIIPLLLVYITIIYFSLKKPSGQPALFNNIDKIEHFIAYFTLGFIVCLSIINKKMMYLFLSLSLMLGLAMEYIQGTLPYRDMSLADGISNIFGLIIGVIVFKLFRSSIYSFFEYIKLEKIFYKKY